MAEIIIKFDTKAKTLTVSKDGSEVPNVVCVDVCRADYYGYGYGGEGDEEEDFKFSLTQMSSDKGNSTKEMIRTIANKQGELVKAETEKMTPEEMRATAKERQLFRKATNDIEAYFKEGF